MTIQLDGAVVASTMRTPGHDFELAAGYCWTEGLLHGAPVDEIRYCSTGSAVETHFNVVDVGTAGRAPVPRPRLAASTSSCGWCGSDQLDDLIGRLAPLPASDPIALDVILSMPERMSDHQPLHAATGAVHAAALVTGDGDIVVAREDVGRHNAVDKVIGSQLLAGNLPAAGHGLFVSSRASVEIVQKAWSAGCSTLVAVSAPTALAVDAARRAGMTLVGFVRDGTANVYAPERFPAPVAAGPADGDGR